MRFSGPGWYSAIRHDFRPFSVVYDVGVKAPSAALLTVVLAMLAAAQTAGTRLPRFEDFPVAGIFTGKPAPPKRPSRRPSVSHKDSGRRSEGTKVCGPLYNCRLGLWVRMHFHCARGCQ